MPPDSGRGATGAARLLLIENDPEAGRHLAAEFGRCLAGSPEIIAARSGREAAEFLRAGPFDIVIADLSSLRDLAAPTEEAVARLVKLAAGALTIALSEASSVSAAVEAMRAGAHDYIAKPLNGQAFAARIGELAQRHGKAQAFTMEAGMLERGERYAGFVGTSPQMQFVYQQIERIAASAAPVFITGERGTGKDLCAEALHERGPRAGRRFVAVNCAAIPRELLESELFGMVRGAHSGAQQDCKGAAELADGGTLFLDEVGALDLSLQGKLLRLLQSGAIGRVGEASLRQLDVRVICATAGNPMQLIADKSFREDLFYRLHVLPIHLPPLRQRASDIPLLAQHFLELHGAEEHKHFSGLSENAATLLTAREWPGNVRQLQTLLRRVVVMFDGGEVGIEMLEAADIEGIGPGERPAGAAREHPVLPMWVQEQRIIEAAIQSFGGNVALAAAALELSPSTIYRKRQAWADMADRQQGAA